MRFSLHNISGLMIAFWLIVSFQNCAPKGGNGIKGFNAKEFTYTSLDASQEEEGTLWYSPLFESSVTDENLRKTVLSDLLRYQNMKGLLDVPAGNFAVGIFGSTEESRLAYISDRIKSFQSTSSTDPAYSGLIAANFGALYFIERKAWLQVGNTANANKYESYTDSRLGSMFLIHYPLMNSVARIGTLVHEARHSDCTGGLKTSFINTYINNHIQQKTWRNAESACLHYHNKCPVGHDMAGEVACDTHLWGAYAAGGMFNLLVDTKCTNCTTAEKYEAMLDSQDQFDRVIQVDKILDESAPWPDMTHSITLIEDETPVRSEN
ncbi:MAG: hypothetical protein AB7O96_04410 [Pseudobdellovibrionaceae bacterium]